MAAGSALSQSNRDLKQSLMTLLVSMFRLNECGYVRMKIVS